MVSPLSHVTSFDYDELSRLDSIEDAEERTFETAYDSGDRLATVQDPGSNIAVTKAYSDNGSTNSLKDARDNETTFTRDGHDRLESITYPDSSIETFSWDDNGNLLSFTNRAGDTIAFEYDELNRLRTKTPDNQPEVSFEYDLAGRLKSASTPVVANHPESGEFEYFYDTAGRLIREEAPDGKNVEYELDENGNVIKITYPDTYFVEREFDELNRLSSITLNGAMTPALVFEYDHLSRRHTITADNGVVTQYTHREDNRLESIEHTFDGSSVRFGYAYNDAGELIEQSIDDADFIWHPSTGGTETYGTAADNNTYPTVGGTSQSYNDNGCLTNDGTWNYSYDTENHLVSASDGVTSAVYLYDPLHRQMQKEVGGSKTRFVYGGIQRLADYNGSNDTLQNRFVYGVSLDDVLLQVSAGGTITYLHADRLGSIVATSDNTGANTAKYQYGPFGETPSLSGITHGYTGQRLDGETGLYFMKSRYHSPVTGRFNQPDVIGYNGGLHLYNYVGNSPLNAIDPMGTDPNSDGRLSSWWDPLDLWRRMNTLGWNAYWGIFPNNGGGAPFVTWTGSDGKPMITFASYGKYVSMELVNPSDWYGSTDGLPGGTSQDDALLIEEVFGKENVDWWNTRHDEESIKIGANIAASEVIGTIAGGYGLLIAAVNTVRRNINAMRGRDVLNVVYIIGNRTTGELLKYGWSADDISIVNGVINVPRAAAQVAKLARETGQDIGYTVHSIWGNSSQGMNVETALIKAYKAVFGKRPPLNKKN